MAYVPHDWETGEVITEELLDHMEQGIVEATEEGADKENFIVTLTGDDIEGGFTSNKTASEISEAFNSGKFVYAVFNGYTMPIAGVATSGDIIYCSFDRFSITTGAFKLIRYFVNTNGYIRTEFTLQTV